MNKKLLYEIITIAILFLYGCASSTPTLIQSSTSTISPPMTSTPKSTIDLSFEATPTLIKPLGTITLNDFKNSRFCEQYKCKFDESRILNTGEMDTSFEIPEPDSLVELISDSDFIDQINLLIWKENKLNNQEIFFIYSFLQSINPEFKIDQSLQAFVVDNIENSIIDNCKTTPYQFGYYKIWISNHVVTVADRCD